MNALPKVTTRRSKRLGRGYGSGKGGHTVGRGQKGQKARGSVHILFEGLKVKKSLLHRLPMQRGKGKFKARTKPFALNLDSLNKFPAGTVINIESLAKAGLVNEHEAHLMGVKILGNGQLDKNLTVELPSSKQAIEKIEKSGGKVVIR